MAKKISSSLLKYVRHHNNDEKLITLNINTINNSNKIYQFPGNYNPIIICILYKHRNKIIHSLQHPPRKH